MFTHGARRCKMESARNIRGLPWQPKLVWFEKTTNIVCKKCHLRKKKKEDETNFLIG